MYTHYFQPIHYIHSMTIREQIHNYAEMYQSEAGQKDARFLQWDKKIPELKQLLEEICTELEGEHSYFADKLTVGEYAATINAEGETLKAYDIRSVYVQSARRELVRFKVPDVHKHQNVTLVESGFELHFSPQLNGKINAYAFGHIYGEEQGQQPPFSIISSFEMPEELTTEAVETVFLRFMEFVQPSSYLFEQQVVTFKHYPPIGFRYQERII